MTRGFGSVPMPNGSRKPKTIGTDPTDPDPATLLLGPTFCPKIRVQNKILTCNVNSVFKKTLRHKRKHTVTTYKFQNIRSAAH